MSDNTVPTETLCTECGHQPDNEPPNFCPECGNDEWKSRAKYDFERDVDLPFVFSMEVYSDDYELWREFCYSAFDANLKGKNIANLPNNFPRMKYCTPLLYFKLTEDLDLEGPYLSKQEARDA